MLGAEDGRCSRYASRRRSRDLRFDGSGRGLDAYGAENVTMRARKAAPALSRPTAPGCRKQRSRFRRAGASGEEMGAAVRLI